MQCTIVRNQGSGIWLGYSGLRHVGIDRTIIAENTGTAVNTDGPPELAELSCCDLWGNGNGDWVGPIASQYGVDGNISADPMFCDPSSLELYLDRASPCAPPNTDCQLIGAWDVGCDVVGTPVSAWKGAGSLRLAASPNPSTGRTILSFHSLADSGFELEIYSPLGRLVRSYAGNAGAGGAPSILWDCRDARGSRAPAGVYFIRLRCAGRTASEPVVLLR